MVTSWILPAESCVTRSDETALGKSYILCDTQERIEISIHSFIKKAKKNYVYYKIVSQ